MSEPIKILILEDDPNDVDLLNWNLKKSQFNFTAEFVKTRSAFENALDQFKPDIILSDYSLPGFNGVAAYDITKKKYSDVPFIIVSSSIGEERAVELIKRGVTDYALKDKLFTLPTKIIRALREAREKEGKRIADQRIDIQRKKLLDIAYIQSHQVRAIVARILGIINLFNFKNPLDRNNIELIHHLEKTTLEFDKVIHQIVRSTEEIEESEKEY